MNTENTNTATGAEVTENTLVNIALPLGLARAVVVALAFYAGQSEMSRQAAVAEGGSGEHDNIILRSLAAANDIVREAAKQVEPGFDKGAALSWAMLAGPANNTIAQFAREGKLAPGAIAEMLDGQKQRAAEIIADVKANGGATVGDLLGGAKRNADTLGESSKGKTLH